MLVKKKNGFTWLEFDLFQDLPIKHGIFLKQNNQLLNMSFQCGIEEKVALTHKRVTDLFDLEEMVFPHIVHGNKVIHVDREYKKTKGDAISTTIKDVGLLTTHADCQAAIFYDPINQAIANAHVGWRGNVKNTYQEVVLAMKKWYGSDPKELLVGVSPSLGPKHAEFVNYREELPESFWKYQVKPYYFDLWEITRQQLLGVGVVDQHIEMAKECTYANEECFFSYRREPTAGRHGTVAALIL